MRSASAQEDRLNDELRKSWLYIITRPNLFHETALDADFHVSALCPRMIENRHDRWLGSGCSQNKLHIASSRTEPALYGCDRGWLSAPISRASNINVTDLKEQIVIKPRDQ